MSKRTKSDSESSISNLRKVSSWTTCFVWPVRVPVTLRKLRFTLCGASTLDKMSDPGWAVRKIFGQAPGSSFSRVSPSDDQGARSVSVKDLFLCLKQLCSQKFLVKLQGQRATIQCYTRPLKPGCLCRLTCVSP